jgi:hypothetical protein
LAQGIEIERSALAFWVGYAAAELMPLWRRLRDILLGSPRLFVDETRAPVWRAAADGRSPLDETLLERSVGLAESKFCDVLDCSVFANSVAFEYGYHS